MLVRSATLFLVFAAAAAGCAKKDKGGDDTKGGPDGGEAEADSGVDTSIGVGTIAISATLPAGSTAATAIMLDVRGPTVSSFAEAESTPIAAGQIALTIDPGPGPEPGMPLTEEGAADSDVAKGVMMVTIPAGDDKFETGSAMQFIEVPASSSSSLVKLPVDLLGDKTEVDLGQLADNGGSLSASTVSGGDLLQTEAGLLAELAGTDNGLKLVRNRYMNGDRGTDKYLEITPQYMFAGDLAPFLAGSDYVAASFVGDAKNTKYLGYLLRFGGRHPDLAVADLCRASLDADTAPKKELTLTPPQKDLAGKAQTPELIYNADTCQDDISACPKGTVLSSKKTAKVDGSTTSCKGDHDNDGADYFSFQIQTIDGKPSVNFDWGSGAGYRGAIPAGLWDLKLDGKLIGRFDIGSAFPMSSDAADAYPLIYVPLIKVTRNGAKAVQTVDLKFAMWNPATSAYDEITDLKLFKSIVSGLIVRMEDLSTSGWSSQDGDGISVDVPMPASGNVLTADFKTADKTWILDTENVVDNDDEDTPHAHSFVVSYELYGVTYRFDMRP